MEVSMIVDWKQIGAFIGVVTVVNGGYMWILYHKFRDKLDGVYMKKDECEANHKVTDMAIVSMRDDIKEMKNTNNQILGILLEAKNVLPSSTLKKRKKRKKRS